MRLGRVFRRGGKAALATALELSGAANLLREVARQASGGRRVVIVAFHRVVADFEREVRRAIPGLLIGEATFEAQLDALHRAGFEVAPLDFALQVLSGERTSRRDLAVLTFDDGYRDVHAHALPILRRRGLPATVYLASGCIGSGQPFPHDRLYALLLDNLFCGERSGRRAEPTPEAALQCAALVERLIAGHSARALETLMDAMATRPTGALAPQPSPSSLPLDWAEVRTLAGAGVALGAHTVRHAVLVHEEAAAIEREIVESRQKIERETGQRVLDFAYPNGLFDPRVLAALGRAGFRSAVTTEDAPNRAAIDPLRLRRKTLWERTGQGAFGHSARLSRCQLDDLFGLLSLTRPERGLRPSPGA